MSPKPTVTLAVVVLTHNEEANLPACLESLRGIDCALFVVDSGSTDRTLQIAKEYGARVLAHPFESHAKQWRWSLDNLPCRPQWILGLDADQKVTPELRAELIRLFTREQHRLQGIDGFYLNRRQVFRGRWIRHGGYYPKYMLKLFRPSKVYLDDNDLMDHHFYVIDNTAKLSCDMIEENEKESDIAFWIDKHNRYALMHAREELIRRSGSGGWPVSPSLVGSPDQRVLWFKQRWYSLPLYVRSILYFLYRYFLRLGFLDGKEGFVFHFLQGLWYRLLVDINVDQLSTQQPHSLDRNVDGNGHDRGAIPARAISSTRSGDLVQRYTDRSPARRADTRSEPSERQAGGEPMKRVRPPRQSAGW